MGHRKVFVRNDGHRDEDGPRRYSRRTVNGQWVAHGNGWAVWGDTQEEALQIYWKAVELHQAIAKRGRVESDADEAK